MSLETGFQVSGRPREVDGLTWHGCSEKSDVTVRDRLGMRQPMGIQGPAPCIDRQAGVASGPLT